MLHSLTLETKNGFWAIKLAGVNVEGTIVAFHGFDRDTNFYERLVDAVGDRFRLILVDLPYHGETRWSAEYFTPEDLLELFDKIAGMDDLQSPVHLMGHSLAGRLLLTVLPDLPFAVDRMIALTPDGIAASRGSFFSDKIPFRLRCRYKKIVLDGRFILSAAYRLNKLYLLPDFHLRYVQRQLGTPESRQRVYHTWLSQFFFRVKPRRIWQWIRENKPGALLWVFAQQDKIVLTDAAIRHLHKNKLDEGSSVVVFQDGHELRSIDWKRLFE
jgi:pimeloyl-ACP methyl ester carboxylesterase